MLDLEGQLLIAKRRLKEAPFRKSVVLILNHGPHRSSGVILNRPSKATMTDLAGGLFDEEFVWDKPLQLGGPVKSALRVLHTDEQLGDRELVPGVFLIDNATKAQHILSQRIDPSIVFANHCEWISSRLETQIEQGLWSQLPAKADYLFWNKESDLWTSLSHAALFRALAKDLGVRHFSPQPYHN
jgi:putative transcriptional regulator